MGAALAHRSSRRRSQPPGAPRTQPAKRGGVASMHSPAALLPAARRRLRMERDPGRRWAWGAMQQLIYGGKTLSDECQFGFCSIPKESLLHLLRKGRSQQPRATDGSGNDDDDDEDDEDEDEASLRVNPADGSPEFDGSDGWAVAERLRVSAAQRWYRDTLQHETLGWKDWGESGNSLIYLLKRALGLPTALPAAAACRAVGPDLGRRRPSAVANLPCPHSLRHAPRLL